MLSKAKIKYIKSLQLKKYRKQEQCFVVEGGKVVAELLRSHLHTRLLLATEAFLHAQGNNARAAEELLLATESELAGLGGLETNREALAIVGMPPNQPLEASPGELSLALDGIRDPGNLGTIVRVADWYGIRKIIASPDTADLYNGKVIRASMGSFLRVSLFYTDLVEFLGGASAEVLGAFVDGADVHRQTLAPRGVLVIGNESEGIRKELHPLIHRRLSIPRYGGAESLNAAVACAILCDNLYRDQKKP